MKFETSDILNDEYKFELIKLRMHRKVKYNIVSQLFLKQSITNYKFIHIAYIILSSIGLLILSNEFMPREEQQFFSNYIGEITIYSFTKRLKITHSTYLIICAIIFLICIYRLISMLYFSYQSNRTDPFDSFKNNKSFIVRILNHIVYVLFSYIIEFLSFIFYIEIFPNKFIIKKDSNVDESFQIVFLVLNSIFIITYNINNYYFVKLIDRPLSPKTYPIKFRFAHAKVIILMLMQNFGMIHPLKYYIKETICKILCIVYFGIIALFLIIIYFMEINTYNIGNLINSIISFLGEFCFVSVLIEILIYVLDIKCYTFRELLYFVFIKVILSLCLYFCLKKIYYKIMVKLIRKKIFNNPYNNQFDKELNDSILFIREMHENKNKKFLSQINELFIEHKKNCSNNNCACKLIVLKKLKKNNDLFNLEEVIKKLNYFIESILIHFNYQNDYLLSLLLSEHFLIYKDNPLMAYSILQTLLHTNLENLTKDQLIIIYECMTKYIKIFIKNRAKRINIEKQNGAKLKLLKINKEEELSQYFHLAIKIKTVIKFMIKYSTEFLSIVHHKDNYESSTIVKIDEIFNEIKYIISPYLTTKILNSLLKFLSLENNYTQYIEKHILDLEEYSRNLTYEFLYKIFLFADFFWNGKIPEKLLKIFYIFNIEHFIYSTEINQQIYPLLESKYNELYNNSQTKFFILLKFTKGIKISYISEMLARKMNYKQAELINNDLGILLLRELIQPHENLTKKQFILNQNNVIKDKYKFIFDKNGYMHDMKLNSTFQIGLNKNILMLSSIEIDKGKNIMKFYLNRNLKIISINKNFEDKLFISLALIREFNIELKDLFGINMNDINYNYRKELKKIRSIKEFKVLDTREYVLKNLFKKKGMNNNYHIISKYIINDKDDEINDKDNERERILKENPINHKNNYKIEKKINNLFNNIALDTFKFSPIFYIINNKNFQNNLRLIFEKINSYEQDKLESKNIFNDFMKLTTNVNENIYDQNHFMNLAIKPRLIYDTIFFLCKIEIYSQSRLIGIKKDLSTQEQLDEENEREFSNNNLIYQNNILTSNKVVWRLDQSANNPQEVINEEDIGKMRKIGEKNSNYFQKKIRKVKTPKYKLFIILTLCILILLVTNIITFNYQNNLVSVLDNIFNAIFYNYYQRAQFISVNTIILSMYYQILNISIQHDISEKQKVISFLAKNIEGSRILFINSFMDFQIELGNDFTQLYESFESNKITVNWENQIFVNDYRTKTALILIDMFDVAENKIIGNNSDIFDCNNLLLEKYLKIDRKNTPVYGNFIRLLYYFVINYEVGLFQFFKKLESSFYDSLDTFSRQTKIINLVLEIIIILLFISFFFINLYFLIQNNKYMFKNILYMFIDFTQDKTYDLNNKITNLLIEKKVKNYISLLKEFTPDNLDILKFDNKVKYLYKERQAQNISVINEEEEKSKDSSPQNKNKSKTRKIKSIAKFITNKKTANLSDKNSIFKIYSYNYSEKNNNAFLKNDIRTLNNKELNLINTNTNKIINVNNSRNNSTNVLLDSTMNSLNNNSLISGGMNSIKQAASMKMRQKQNKSKEEDNSQNLNMHIDDLEIYQNEEDYELTIDKIFHKTKVSTLKSIKIIIIIFIIFTLIFIIYSFYKILTFILFIQKFNNIVKDFSSMILQYNEVIRYWNNIKTLFILPNVTQSIHLEETENYFYGINNKVNYILNNRINNYKRIKNLYEVLSDSSRHLNETGIDFCLGHQKCLDVFYSNELLTKDVESTVNLYAKEIENYYKDFNPNKNKIESIDDIKRLFINDKYELLSLNINHVFIYIEQVFLKFFMEDEKDIMNQFHFENKILNSIEVCYCALLNLFSALFVYTYINRIIYSVEISANRINESIQRIKLKSL